MRAAVGAIALSSAFAAPQAQAGTGSVQQYAYDSSTGVVHFRVFTPSSYNPSKPAPLVVFTHGCNTTAAQQQAASLYDPVAEREGFVVMYPDNDDSAHPAQCWRFYDASNKRGAGDLATIAGMTRAVMGMRSIDRQRVYQIAMSSGALITSDLAGAYPELYAAIGIMNGSPYGPDSCLSGLNGAPAQGDPSQQAAAARAEEGPRARVMPFVVLNGDQDNTVSPACDDQAVQQWLRTNNLVVSGRQDRPLGLAPASDQAATKPGGYRYNVLSYRQPSGCLIGQHWVIHGMDHFWSGGTSDPAYAAFTDPKGPSAAEASWAFFSRYRLSSTSGSCAEASRGSSRRPSRRAAAPRIRIAGARRCIRKRARLRVRITTRSPLKSVRVRLKGRTLLRTTKKRFTLRIRAVRLSGSRPRLTIVARNRAGRRTVRRVVLHRCKRSGPRSAARAEFAFPARRD